MPLPVAALMGSSTQVSIPAACGGQIQPVGMGTWVMPGQVGQEQKGTHTLSYAVLTVGSLPSSTGRKQDTWFVVDPESGETHMTLTTEGLSTPRLYIGRTRKSDVPYAP